MNKKNYKLITILVVSLIVFTSIIVFSEPGSENDPLVTQSYVNQKIEELKQYIDSKVANVGSSNNSGNVGNINSSSLEVIELRKGQYLIGASGTEIILRGGKAKAHGVKVDAGITDITAGVDIDSNESLLPYNHMLIIPRNDGRGVYAVEDAVFMVKGSYEIR